MEILRLTRGTLCTCSTLFCTVGGLFTIMRYAAYRLLCMLHTIKFNFYKKNTNTLLLSINSFWGYPFRRYIYPPNNSMSFTGKHRFFEDFFLKFYIYVNKKLRATCLYMCNNLFFANQYLLTFFKSLNKSFEKQI